MSDFLTRMAQYSRGEAGEAAVVTPVLAGLYGPQAESEAVETVVDVVNSQGKIVQTETAGTIAAVAAERGILQQPAVQKRAEPQQSIVAEPVFPQPERKRGEDVQRALSPELLIADSPLAGLHDSDHVHAAAKKQIQPSSVVEAISLAGKAFQAAFATDNSNDNSDASWVADMQLVNNQASVTAAPAPLLVPPQRGGALHGGTGSVSQDDMAERNMVELTTLAGEDVQKEPAIHITIGRIDVRAQMPASVAVAPRSRPTSESSLSLSTYLKRGGGGT